MSSQCYSVVGVTFEGRQDILSDFYKSYRHGGHYDVMLEREPDNQYDKNAISVSLDVGNSDFKKVGYISKQDNELLGTVMDRLKTAKVHSMGPNYKGDIGLTIEAEFDD